jgi:hypothetical protein
MYSILLQAGSSSNDFYWKMWDQLWPALIIIFILSLRAWNDHRNKKIVMEKINKAAAETTTPRFSAN